MHGSDLSVAIPLATLVKVHPFWTQGGGGGEGGRGGVEVHRFQPVSFLLGVGQIVKTHFLAL